MTRSVLAALFVVALFPISAMSADEYLIHVEQFGYEDVSNDEQPIEELLDSMQFVARPGVPFYARVGTRGTFTKVSGKLQPDDNGTWLLNIHYSDRAENADTSVTSAEGTRIPGIHTRGVETQVNVKLGRMSAIGRFQNNGTRTVEGKTQAFRSSIEFRVRVTEFKPGEMSPEDIEVADLERLQHSWSAIKMINNGETADESLPKQIGFRFEADRLILAGPEPRLGARRFKIRLETTTSPRAMQLTALEGRWKGQSITALYDLSSGDLQICIPEFGADGRPDKLESPVGSKLKLITLKKD